MEIPDIQEIETLTQKYRISEILSVLYWCVVRKRNRNYAGDNIRSRELTDLANRIDELEQFADKILE